MGAVTGDQLKSVAMTVDQQAILRYADITGDHNPLHVDAEFAAGTPMGGVIAHGTLSMNLIWQSLAATFGEKAVRGASLDIRFVAPVRVGDRVEAGGSAKGESIEVWVQNQAGEKVIEGVATLSAGVLQSARKET